MGFVHHLKNLTGDISPVDGKYHLSAFEDMKHLYGYYTTIVENPVSAYVFCSMYEDKEIRKKLNIVFKRPLFGKVCDTCNEYHRKFLDLVYQHK